MNAPQTKRRAATIAGTALVTLLAVGLGYGLLTGQDINPAQAEITDPDVVLHVGGMNCEHCSMAMGEQLQGVAGVSGVQVLLDEQRVHLKLSRLRSVSEEELHDVVTDVGFALREVEYVSR